MFIILIFNVFFLLNFLSRNFVSEYLSPISPSQNLLLRLFLAPKFFLVQKFCTTTFLIKIYGSQNILVQTLMYSNFCLQIFCFFNFFILKFFVKTFISNFSISESFAWTFLAPNFFLVQKFCTTTFLSKICRSQNILAQTFTEAFRLEFFFFRIYFSKLCSELFV